MHHSLLYLIFISQCISCGVQKKQKSLDFLNGKSKTLVAASQIEKNQFAKVKKEGFWSDLNPKKEFSEAGYYKNGIADGWMKWYYFGNLVAEGNMFEGKRDGIWKICDIHDLSLCIEGRFILDKKEGGWQVLHDNGQVRKKQLWSKGILTFEQCWDTKGKKTACP